MTMAEGETKRLRCICLACRPPATERVDGCDLMLDRQGAITVRLTPAASTHPETRIDHSGASIRFFFDWDRSHPKKKYRLLCCRCRQGHSHRQTPELSQFVSAMTKTPTPPAASISPCRR